MDNIEKDLLEQSKAFELEEKNAKNKGKTKPPVRESAMVQASCTQIRDLFLKEAKSMTRYAMSAGMTEIPDYVYADIEAFSVEYEERERAKERQKGDWVFDAENALDLTKLVAAHDLLSNAIKPATPRTVLLLDPVFADKKGFAAWLSPIPLLRRLMIVAFLSLMGFIAIALSPLVTANGGNIYSSDGLPLFVNLMFFVFSAALGASFSALFQANGYITTGIFDPKYEPSYWIRLLVGVMAGLILASLIPLDDPHALNGLGKPTLSLLGGFSASLVYRILNLLVDTVENMVKRLATAMLGK